ncbi:MAG TPA: hypothetical protein VLG50_08045 [Candidatus Saccharimonadales bacterium]|nr:hypothetical protein [Candidatus Saccharimonadales bacterium]
MNETESPNYAIWFIIGIVFILFIVAIIILIIYLVHQPSNKDDIKDDIIGADDDIEETDVIDAEPLPIELDLGGTTKYSLYCVPAIQPPLNKEAKKYGGYHMTLFPSQSMPSNYSIVNAMQGFRMNNTQWNLQLPGITTKVKQAKSKNLVIMMVYGASTINTLKNYLQTSAGGSWTKPWGSNHVTLGTIDPPDQAKPEDFTSQTTWYVQLVRNPGHHWLPNERVLLYIAQGKNN